MKETNREDGKEKKDEDSEKGRKNKRKEKRDVMKLRGRAEERKQTRKRRVQDFGREG
jgi:hypothetical protein